MGPRWGFSGITKSQCIELFWFVLDEVMAVEMLKIEQNYFSGKKRFLVLSFGPKLAQIGQKWRFSWKVSWKIYAWKFFDFLHEVTAG